MIRYERVVGHLRFYARATDDPFADYQGVATVVWDSPDTVTLMALHADMTRAMQRELLDWLVQMGIRKVRAHRAPKRSLPFARRVDDHDEIAVADLVARFKVADQPKPHRREGDAG